MSGGGSTTTTTTDTQTRLSDELRGASVGALSGAENLYNQGTEGIYQGTQLAEQDPLVRAAQEQLLSQYGEGGNLSNLINQQQAQYQNYLNAGDLENNPLFQRQMSDILDQANISFQRGAVPLMQQASAAGQYGGSEGQEGLGLLGGEINRNTQQALTNAALGQQDLGFRAQTLMPQILSTGMMGANIMGDIGSQRTQRGQMELLDQINQFNAPRAAELQNLMQYYNLLGSNPLMGESNQKSTSVAQTEAASDPFGTALGIGLSVAGLPTAGGGSLGGSFLSSLGGSKAGGSKTSG